MAEMIKIDCDNENGVYVLDLHYHSDDVDDYEKFKVETYRVLEKYSKKMIHKKKLKA